jgi:hypothetical protein
MLAKLRQLERAQGFVHLMYNLLEMLGKIMEFMLPSGNAVCGNGQWLLPVHALNPLMRMRAYRLRWRSLDLSLTGRTRYLNPARHLAPWSPFFGVSL